jgi:hypothetical protein
VAYLCFNGVLTFFILFQAEPVCDPNHPRRSFCSGNYSSTGMRPFVELKNQADDMFYFSTSLNRWDEGRSAGFLSIRPRTILNFQQSLLWGSCLEAICSLIVSLGSQNCCLTHKLTRLGWPCWSFYPSARGHSR